MTKKLLAALCASAMVLAACTACGGSSSVAESSAETTTTAGTTTTAETAAVVDVAPADDLEIEPAVVAKSGDALLAITDGQWYCQYWGKDEDILTYDAGVVPITGDGDYTVSVSVATTGAQYDITDGQGPFEGYQCEGLGFAMVQVLDGTTLFPNMSIEIKEIRVDGKAVELKAKNYTSSDDGKEMRSNIYNEWVNKLPDDAHNADGAVTGEIGEYSPKIVDPADFAKWSTIEVDFTVTGTGDAAAVGGDTTDATGEAAPAADTTAAAADTTAAAADTTAAAAQ